MKLFAAFLALGILSGCGPHRPKLTFCMIRAEDEKLYCSTPDGKEFNLVAREADKYLCLSPNDQTALFNYVVDLEKKAAKAR